MHITFDIILEDFVIINEQSHGYITVYFDASPRPRLIRPL